MTDTVHPNKIWHKEFEGGTVTHGIYNEQILTITLNPIHVWNLDDKNNGTNTLYNNIVSLIQEAQLEDIDCKLKFVVLDCSIESMSFFQSPNKPNCPSSIITELADDFSNDGYKFVWSQVCPRT